jgi:hypothetical protein
MGCPWQLETLLSSALSQTQLLCIRNCRARPIFARPNSTTAGGESRRFRLGERMPNNNSQRDLMESGRLFIVSGSAQCNEPNPVSPPDFCCVVTVDSLGEAGELEAILFRPRLHFADEDLAR